MSDIQTDKPADPFAPVSGGGPSAIALFGESIYINPEKRLPALDQGPVRAYAASGMADVSQVTHYAMICEPHLTPRVRSAPSYATLSNTGLVKLVSHGAFYWPPARGERYAFIYEMPVGRPMLPEGQHTGMTMRPDIILGPVLNSILPSIADLHDAGIVHGNIRTSTIYGVGAGAGVVERVILGECLSVPAAFNQPPMFLPVELAMTAPLGRAPRTLESDLYALGVSLAVMVRTRDPMEEMNNDEALRYRLEIGSLAAYTGKDRISGNLVELLRGLLNDDPDLRWTVQEVIAWLDGQHIPPKQGLKKSKAARPLTYENERYFRPQLLAMDLGKNQAGSAQLVETKALEQWISRSLEDSSVLKRLEEATEKAGEQGHGPGYWDRLLCMVSVALDPDAPIRFKGLSFFPEGFGACLTGAMVLRTDLQPYIDVINQKLASFWVLSQRREDSGGLITLLENCSAFLRQNNIAYGIERCLYLLNPDCHCLSEKLKGYYVRTPEDLMRAFEKIATQPGRPELFFDRHAVAFLSVKDRTDVDGFLIELNAHEHYKKIIGNIKTLATIQQRSRMERMPGICKWISEILDPVYARIHDRELRVKLKTRVAGLVEGGDISKIAGLLTNPQTLTYDLDAFNQARMEYFKLVQEQATLEKKMARPSLFGQGIGREVAALVSCALSALAILFFVFMLFSKGPVMQ